MSDTKKPVDPSFGHHSVVKERPQQESSATMAKNKCSVAGCTNLPAMELGSCLEHEKTYGAEWSYCVVMNCFNPRPCDEDRCAKHGGLDYTPRTTADHPNPAPPEAKPCDDGKEETTQEGQCVHCEARYPYAIQLHGNGPYFCIDHFKAMSIAEELLDLGVPPHRYLTPEERAQDQAEWRVRVRASIEETQRQKAAEGEATK